MMFFWILILFIKKRNTNIKIENKAMYKSLISVSAFMIKNDYESSSSPLVVVFQNALITEFQLEIWEFTKHISSLHTWCRIKIVKKMRKPASSLNFGHHLRFQFKTQFLLFQLSRVLENNNNNKTNPCSWNKIPTENRPASGGVVVLKINRREVPGSNPDRACRLRCSEFSVFFIENRINTD